MTTHDEQHKEASTGRVSRGQSVSARLASCLLLAIFLGVPGLFSASGGTVPAPDSHQEFVLAQAGVQILKGGAQLIEEYAWPMLRSIWVETEENGLRQAAKAGSKKAGNTLGQAAAAGAEAGEKANAEKQAAQATRKPRNSQYAGKTYPKEKLPPELQKKYPKSVPFDKDGYPDFSAYTKKTVEVEGLTGNHAQDVAKANKAAGYDKTPDGHTWHHCPDGKTMQLVPSDLHAAVPHTGGASMLRSGSALLE